MQGVDNNFDPDWKTVYGSTKIIDGIKKESKKADQIFIATDPDREGEGIGSVSYTHLTLPTKRIV